MKISIRKRTILVALVAFFAMGAAVYADTANVPVSAVITAPTLDLTTTPPTALDFGGIIAGNTGNTIVALDSSANTASTPVNLNGGDASLDGTGNSGTITVSSNLDATLTVTINSVTGDAGNAGFIENFDGSAQLALLPATVASNTPATLAVTAGTPETLHVGGLLTVANTADAATYGGTIVVDISY